MGEVLDEAILDCLAEKPMSISEIAREIDEKKYEVSKRIDVLEASGQIKTYKIGRSTAVLLREEVAAIDNDEETDTVDDDTVIPEAEESVVEADEAANIDTETDEDDDDLFAGRPAFLDDDDDVAATASSELQTESGSDGAAVTGPVAGSDAGAGSAQTVVPASTALEADEPDDMPGSEAVAEQARAISARSNAGTGEMPRTIGIVSGKGGVGKTVVTLNLATALMELGEKVVVIDADTEMSNVGLHLGMYTQSVSLQDVLENDMPLMSAMYIHTETGMRIIPASLRSLPADEARNVREAFTMIPSDHIVLIDSAPGFTEPLENVIDACDELLFVTTPEIPSVTDTYKLYEASREKGKHVLGIVLNMYENPKDHLSVTEVEESLGVPVISVIKKDRVIKRSIFQNTPAVDYKPHGKAAHAFKQLAADLTDAEYEPGLVEKLRRYLP